MKHALKAHIVPSSWPSLYLGALSLWTQSRHRHSHQEPGGLQSSCHRRQHCRLEGWASQVMSVVKGLMKTGMTICATIHSPTPFCFRLFDRMMILLRGHMVYAGPNGTPFVLSYRRWLCCEQVAFT